MHKYQISWIFTE